MKDAIEIIGGMAAGGAIVHFYLARAIAAEKRISDALRGILDSYRQHLTEIVSAIKVKL